MDIKNIPDLLQNKTALLETIRGIFGEDVNNIIDKVR